MKRVLTILTICLGLALVPFAASAEEATATVIQIKGKVSVVNPLGGKETLGMGQKLSSGDRVVTQGGATVTLLLEDGSQIAVGANTDMTLTQLSKEGDSHKTFFSLFEGLIRATVQKLTIGSAFELSSEHGVAAVKGTQYEARVQHGKGMEIRVKEGRVWLEDLKREKKVVIDERKSARVHQGRLSKVRSLRKKEIKNFRKWARTSLPRDPKKEARFARFWHSLKPGQKRRFVSAAKESLGETWDDITSLRAEERQAKWKQRLRHADELKLAGEESRVDFSLGNVLIDRKGRRVRMEEFILRPQANIIQFLNYTKREGRTDLISAKHIYNRDLPRNLGDRNLRLGKKVWYNRAPEYWVVGGTVVFANATSGDNLTNVTEFYDPVKTLAAPVWTLPMKSTELRLNVLDLNAPGTGGLLLERYVRRSQTLGAFDTNAAQNTVNMSELNSAGSLVSLNSFTRGSRARNSDLVWAGGIGFVASAGGLPDVANSVAPTSRNLNRTDLGTVSGDIAGGFLRSYADGTKVGLASYLIDEQGVVRNTNTLLASTNGDLFEAMIQLAFFSFNEVEIRSTAFKDGMNGPGIDVVSKMLWWSTATKTKDDL